MIVYTPLWETMKRKGFTTYTLREKHGVSSNTIRRLKANQHVSTYTLNIFCKLLDCELHDIVIYIKDESPEDK